MMILKKHQELLKIHHVKSIYLFGSVVRGEDIPGSDVDVLVEFEEAADVGLFGLVRLQKKLSEILGRSVDIATQDALHFALKDQILKGAVRAA